MVLAFVVVFVAVVSAKDFCQDHNVWCKYMTKYGACSWNENTQKTCPRTCGLCGVECNVVKGSSRKDCGYNGIQRDECYTKGCCWQPLLGGEVGPWCYESPSNKLPQSL